MKLLFFIFIFLLGSTNSFSQKRLDNAIVIHDSTITQKLLLNRLIKGGYDVDQVSEGYIKTSFRGNKNNAGSNRLTFLYDGDSIIARAWSKLDLSIGGVRAADPDLAEYRTMKGNLLGDTFDLLTEFVKSLTSNFYFTKMNK